MDYQGFRVKINDTVIPNVLIAAGTYSFVKEPRVAKTWTDSKGISHKSFHAKDKVKISFSIKERNLEEHRSIKGIFANKKNVTVYYWDDYDCEYKEGNFEMSSATISHRKALTNEILYDSTAITLGEY